MKIPNYSFNYEKPDEYPLKSNEPINIEIRLWWVIVASLVVIALCAVIITSRCLMMAPQEHYNLIACIGVGVL